MLVGINIRDQRGYCIGNGAQACFAIAQRLRRFAPRGDIACGDRDPAIDRDDLLLYPARLDIRRNDFPLFLQRFSSVDYLDVPVEKTAGPDDWQQFAQFVADDLRFRFCK